ncbi:MAG: SUMF1/EgtB/PvdO family nonheme iron enzyme, partial [Pyrinomonadaceae bacterium]
QVPVAEGVKILDFGLAKIKSGELLGSFVQAKTSGLMGSPFYMAPEQWSDEEPDARADIYSLGIILYQMLAGDVPFKGSSIPSIMKKHLTLPPPSFQSIGVQVPPQIEAVVRHALEKEVEARIPSVGEFLTQFRAAVETPGVNIPVRRETGPIDPNRTMVSPLPTTTVPPDVGDQTSYSGPPSISQSSSIALSEEEHEQRERVAREELAREYEARRQIEQEAARKRREDQDRLKTEAQEREELERRHREQLDRVARQASDLEERLAKLATSVPPAVAVVDPDATQVHQSVQTQAVGNNSFPGGPAGAGRGSQVFVDLSPKSRTKPLLLVGAALAILLMVGAGIGGYVILSGKASPPNGNQNEKPTPSPHKASVDVIEIPGGTFQMGRNDGLFQERPQHAETIQPFFMDRTEVTNEEYAEFVRDMNYQVPSHWLRGQPLALQEKWPVVNVSPRDAEAFAAWRSKRDRAVYRLPTEQEWEYAARSGGLYRLFPWGDRWEDKRAVVKEADAKPVGSFPDGANRWGVVDLIGNVWEWTSSKASLYQGNTAGEIPAATREWVVARGGSYSSDPNDRQIPISATYRDWFDPTLKRPNVGFRLVRVDQ